MTSGPTPRPAADRFWPKVDTDGPLPEHRPELGASAGPAPVAAAASEGRRHAMVDTFCAECKRLMANYEKVVGSDHDAARKILDKFDAHRDAKHGSGRPVPR